MPDYKYWANWNRQRAIDFERYLPHSRDPERTKAVIRQHMEWAADDEFKAAEQAARFRR